MDSLSDRLDAERAPGWRPAPGDKIVGVIVDQSEGRDYKGDPYPILTVSTQNGDEIAIHAFHHVLKNELARLRPKMGDKIGVRYIGEDTEKGYHRYRVVGGDGDGIDWGHYDEDPSSTAPTEADARAAVREANKPHDPEDDIPF